MPNQTKQAGAHTQGKLLLTLESRATGERYEVRADADADPQTFANVLGGPDPTLIAQNYGRSDADILIRIESRLSDEISQSLTKDDLEISALRAQRDALATALQDLEAALADPECSAADYADCRNAARAALAAVEQGKPSPFTVEYRADQHKWELMQGGAHRGLFDSEADARAAAAQGESHES